MNYQDIRGRTKLKWNPGLFALDAKIGWSLKKKGHWLKDSGGSIFIATREDIEIIKERSSRGAEGEITEVHLYDVVMILVSEPADTEVILLTKTTTSALRVAVEAASPNIMDEEVRAVLLRRINASQPVDGGASYASFPFTDTERRQGCVVQLTLSKMRKLEKLPRAYMDVLAKDGMDALIALMKAKTEEPPPNT